MRKRWYGLIRLCTVQTEQYRISELLLSNPPQAFQLAAGSPANSHAVGLEKPASNVTKVLGDRLWFELTDKSGHFVRGKDDEAIGLSPAPVGCDTAKSCEETHLNLNEPLRL
jgi:hypothetical protein